MRGPREGSCESKEVRNERCVSRDIQRMDRMDEEEMSDKIPNWNMAYMVAAFMHVGKLPKYTEYYKKYRMMYVDARIVFTRIRLYLKYTFRDMVKR